MSTAVATTTTSPIRALIYTRVSQDKRQGRSVAEQLAECRRWAEREGWQVLEPLGDNDVSASRYAKKEREDWQKVKAALASGLVDVLVTWEASRAQRDMNAYVELRNLCAEHGVQWGYSGKVYDLTDRSDRFRTGLDALVAEDEAERTRERVMRALNANAAQGKPHGQIPFGYKRPKDEKTGQSVGQFLDEVEAPLVREAAERYLSGDTLLGIAKDWNKRGIETPYKAKWGWQSTQIRRILSVAAVNGKRVHQGKVIGEGDWEPILDDITYARVQARLNDSSRKQGTRNSTKAKLLSGVAKCGKCGGPMTFVNQQKPGKQQRPVYTCRYNRHVARDMHLLDAYVEKTLLQWVKSGEIGLPDEADENVTETFAQIAALRQQTEDAYQQFKVGVWDAADYGRLKAENAAEIKQLEKSLKTVNVPTSAHDLITADDPETYWEKRTIEQRREILRAMVEVVVHGTIKQGYRSALEEETISITPRS